MSTTEANETSNYEDIPAVAIQVSRNIVVASIQVDLDDDVIARFREDLLRRIHETDSCRVILDLSGLETLDSHEFTGLRSIISMSTLMGAQSILVGMRPGVVSALIEVGADVDGLLSAIDLDAAYAMLAPEPEPEPEPETEERPESATGVQDELSRDPGEGI
jgi:rsbT antagonist protein RsbS